MSDNVRMVLIVFFVLYHRRYSSHQTKHNSGVHADGLFTTPPANDDDVDNGLNDNVFADDDNMDDDSSPVVIDDADVNSEDSNSNYSDESSVMIYNDCDEDK
jgi:hypothetical protein